MWADKLASLNHVQLLFFLAKLSSTIHFAVFVFSTIIAVLDFASQMDFKCKICEKVHFKLYWS